MSVIGAATRVAATYYWRCRFKAEIEFGTQRILFREVSKSTSSFLDATTHLNEETCSSIGRSVRLSARPCVYPVLFSNDENVFPYVPMTTKFDKDQVLDN